MQVAILTGGNGTTCLGEMKLVVWWKGVVVDVEGVFLETLLVGSFEGKLAMDAKKVCGGSKLLVVATVYREINHNCFGFEIVGKPSHGFTRKSRRVAKRCETGHES